MLFRAGLLILSVKDGTVWEASTKMIGRRESPRVWGGMTREIRGKSKAVLHKSRQEGFPRDYQQTQV